MHDRKSDGFVQRFLIRPPRDYPPLVNSSEFRVYKKTIMHETLRGGIIKNLLTESWYTDLAALGPYAMTSRSSPVGGRGKGVQTCFLYPSIPTSASFSASFDTI